MLHEIRTISDSIFSKTLRSFPGSFCHTVFADSLTLYGMLLLAPSRILSRCPVLPRLALRMLSGSMSPNNEPLQAASFPGDALWDPSWKPAAGENTIHRRMNAESPSVTLYCSWFCPFAQRAWIALEESGTNYLYKEINPYQVDSAEPGGYTKQALSLEEKRQLYPDFVDASPRGLVPAIRHASSRVVWESLPVVEYVDCVFGKGELVPKDDPHERAMVQIWSAHCTERIQKHYYAALMAQNEADTKKALEQYYTECRALSNAMSSSGPFFFGNRFSLVDVALAPFWQRMIWVGGHYMNLTFPRDAEFSRLQQWWEAVSSRPSVAATFVCMERLISSYSQYSRNIATSDFAKSFRN
jgi:glutathione S-transferase